MMRRSRRPLRPRLNTRPCPFCTEKIELTYKDTDSLEKFMTDRGKIVGRLHSNLCQKHQRRVAKAIKRARYLGLLPFVGSRSSS